MSATPPPQPSLLDSIVIASPCRQNWDTMSGDDRVRHCRACDRPVYNFSDLTSEEAEALIQSREARVCGRLYRRPDGRVLTRDCPVGVRGLRAKLARLVTCITALVGLLLSGLALGRTRRNDANAGALDALRERTEWSRIAVVGEIFLASPPAPPAGGQRAKPGTPPEGVGAPEDSAATPPSSPADECRTAPEKAATLTARIRAREFAATQDGQDAGR